MPGHPSQYLLQPTFSVPGQPAFQSTLPYSHLLSRFGKLPALLPQPQGLETFASGHWVRCTVLGVEFLSALLPIYRDGPAHPRHLPSYPPLYHIVGIRLRSCPETLFGFALFMEEHTSSISS